MEVIKEDASKEVKIEVKRSIHELEAYLLCRSERKIHKERSIPSPGGAASHRSTGSG